MTQLELVGVAVIFLVLFAAGVAYFLRLPVVQPVPTAQPAPNTTSGRDVYLGRGYPHPEPLASWYLMTMADADGVTKHQCFRCCWEFLGAYGVRNREDLEFTISYYADPRRGIRDDNDNNVAWNYGRVMRVLLHGAGAGLLSYDEAWSRIRPIAENIRHHYGDLRSFHNDSIFHQRVYLQVPTDGSADPSYLRPRVAVIERYLSGVEPMPTDWNAPLHAPLPDIDSTTRVPADPLFSWLCMLTVPLDDQDLPFFWRPPQARKILETNWNIVDRASFEASFTRHVNLGCAYHRVMLVRVTIAAFRATYIEWETLWRLVQPLLQLIQSENHDFRSLWAETLDGLRDANGLARDGSQDKTNEFVSGCAKNARKWANRDLLADFHAPLA